MYILIFLGIMICICMICKKYLIGLCLIIGFVMLFIYYRSTRHTLNKTVNDIIIKQIQTHNEYDKKENADTLVCILATYHIFSYFQYVFPVWKNFCEMYNYDLYISTDKYTDELPVEFNKIYMLLDKCKTTNYKYVIFVDADTIPVNESFRFEKYTADLKDDKLIIMAEDVYNNECQPTKNWKLGKHEGMCLPNTGIIIVKNTPQSINILEEWIKSSFGECKQYTTTHPNDQLVLWYCVFPTYGNNFKIVSNSEFNSVNNANIVHLMAMNTSSRIKNIIKLRDKTVNIPKVIHKIGTMNKTYQKDGYTYMLWDEKSIRDLISKKFHWFLNIYDKQPNKHNLDKYFILYEYGGIYTENDCPKNLFELVPQHTVTIIDDGKIIVSPKYDSYWIYVWEKILHPQISINSKYINVIQKNNL
jgi:hypothetical protein